MAMTSELAMSLTDGCPSCIQNVEPPRSVVAVDNGWRTGYLCTDCGHAWTTDWAEKALVPLGMSGGFEGPGWDNGGTSKDGPRASRSPSVCAPGGGPEASPTSKESTSA